MSVVERTSDLDCIQRQPFITHNEAAQDYERKLRRVRRNIVVVTDKIESRLKELSYRLECSSFEDTVNDSKPKSVSRSETQSQYSSIDRTDLYGNPASSTVCKTRTCGKLHDMLKNVVSSRLKVYEQLSTVSEHSYQWNRLKDEIEEIEARALITLILPSVSPLDESEVSTEYELELVMKTLEQQALNCVKEAGRMKETLRSSSTGESTCARGEEIRKSVSDADTDLLLKKIFPRIGEAQRILEASARRLYPVLSDYNMRKQTLHVKRIINCACSQIIRHDPGHCLDRLNYLLTFLDGGAIKATGITDTNGSTPAQVTLRDLIPSEVGDIYAWHCLFSSSLSQAEHQFAHSVDSAVVFAALLSGILGRHTEKIPEFFARVFVACPSLGLVAGLDQASEVNTSVANLLETGDPLSKWRGIARLFAALTIAQPPPSLHCPRPPHLSPALLWRTLASLANSQFVPCATAEVLHGLLEVAGEVLLRLYGRQAEKLLTSIINLIHNSPELSMSSPELALVSTIEVALRTGSFSCLGYVEQKFWTNNT
ncbi:unnamed protein product [Calicophoron daubneyi]|uniref:GLE1 RNA export mediator n=1 Tax=Calicophoron daubneyi TaxID=300641 RepID=A0AAV2T3X8_CALDB